jgi:hypothetical protein
MLDFNNLTRKEANELESGFVEQQEIMQVRSFDASCEAWLMHHSDGKCYVTFALFAKCADMNEGLDYKNAVWFYAAECSPNIDIAQTSLRKFLFDFYCENVLNYKEMDQSDPA